MNDTMTRADVDTASSKPVATSDAPPDFGTSIADAFSRAMRGDPKPEAKPAEQPKVEASVEAVPEDPKTEAKSTKPSLSFDVKKGDEPKESRSSSDFKALKGERDTYKAKIDSYEAEVAKMKGELAALSTTDYKSQMDTISKERDELSDQLKASAIERHPKFKAYYDDRSRLVVDQAKKLAGEQGERIAKLLALEDGDTRINGLEEVFASLPASRQAQLGALVTKHDEIRSEREAAISNASTAYEALQQQERQGQQQRRDIAGKTFGEAATAAAALEVYQSREGDADWNSEMGGRLELAKHIFMGDGSEKELAQAALWAASAPKYRELLMAQVELNRRLQSQLSEVQKASPTLRGGGDAAANAAPKSFAERFRELTTA